MPHLIGKAICSAIRADIESLCGVDQLCGGIKCGIEGAIHALNYLHSQHSTSPDWGVLLVNASNVFNRAASYGMFAFSGHIFHDFSSTHTMARPL